MNSKILTVGVLGAGYWGPNLIRNFLASPSWEVRKVADLDEARLARVRRQDPRIVTTTDAQSILRDPSIDAVAIATPPPTHFAFAREALKHGKHVLVEKPLAETSPDARQMCADAKKSGTRLMVDHTFLYTGSVEKLKQLRDNESLGRVFYIDSVRTNLGLYQATSVIWDLAPHDISIINFVLGEEPVAVSAQASACVRPGLADVAFLTMRYPSGSIAHIHVSWLSPVKVRRMMISGSENMAIWDDVEVSEKVKIYDKGIVLKTSDAAIASQLISYRLGDMHAPTLDGTEALSKLIADFHHSIVTGAGTRSDGATGLTVVAAIEAAHESLASNGAWVAMNGSLEESKLAL